MWIPIVLQLHLECPLHEIGSAQYNSLICDVCDGIQYPILWWATMRCRMRLPGLFWAGDALGLSINNWAIDLPIDAWSISLGGRSGTTINLPPLVFAIGLPAWPLLASLLCKACWSMDCVCKSNVWEALLEDDDGWWPRICSCSKLGSCLAWRKWPKSFRPCLRGL